MTPQIPLKSLFGRRLHGGLPSLAASILIQTAAIVNPLASKHRPDPSTTSYMPGTAALLTIRARCKRRSRSYAANGTDSFPTRMPAGSSIRSPTLRTNETLRSAVPPTSCISKPCAFRSTAKAFAFSWPRISTRRRALGLTTNRSYSAERRRRDGSTAQREQQQIPGYDLGTDRVAKSPISIGGVAAHAYHSRRRCDRIAVLVFETHWNSTLVTGPEASCHMHFSAVPTACESAFPTSVVGLAEALFLSVRGTGAFH